MATTFEPGDGDELERIAEAVGRHGYALSDCALPAALLDALFVHVSGLPDQALQRAGVGREQAHQMNQFVRTDETCWLEPEQPASRPLLDWMERLRLALNRRLFLGLFDYEAHFARYLPGAFYRRHRDAFGDGTTNRVLSTVLYLNPAWSSGDGGELVLYADDDRQTLEVVTPSYGRLAVFLSERFPHEVLATRRTRYSIAGWFRVNGSLGGVIDPPR
ncbi:MAG: 2OG-Fe(II) oxygenase [Gammaproteobacteria bacterium]|nr:2OG-Fe(II) oxygenase [Gammaproteobacteria bacterium]